MAEAYAYGLWLALPLATTTDSNTAASLGMLDFFRTLRDFYRAHADLVRGGQDADAEPEVSAAQVAVHRVDFDDGRSVIHLVNHNYDRGFISQRAITVKLPRARVPRSVTLASPDLSADAQAQFSYASGVVTVTVDTLVASLMLVVE